MTCGFVDQKRRLWQKLNISRSKFPRKLLVEFIGATEPDAHSVKLLITSLGKLTPYKQLEASGVSRSLHEFVERLPIDGDQLAIQNFLEGIYIYLEKPPFVERQECRVSQNYAWLLNIAIHAVERLVEKRSPVVFDSAVLSIMLMVPALRFWRGERHSDYKSNLQALVPDWPKLNDELYWDSINRARTAEALKSGGSLVDDWSISWLGHFWDFNVDDLPRLLDWISSRPFFDDRLVALSTAVRVFKKNGSPIEYLSRLQVTVSCDQILQRQLDSLMNPRISEKMRKHIEEEEEYRRKQKEEEEQEKQSREAWIVELRNNPDRIRNPPNLEPGVFTSDQYWLMLELHDHSSATSRTEYANWQDLIQDFGEAVAQAYRDAAVKHWRHHWPSLRSEGAESNGTPFSLIFAMVGLEIEAIENPDFFFKLNEEEVGHVLRYITYELNGFPSWLEHIFQVFPDIVEKSVIKELLWELENTEVNKPMHYILHDIVYYASWLHASIAPVIFTWMKSNPNNINTNRDYCVRIMVNGGIEMAKLTELAIQRIEKANDLDIISWWYALFVDCEPTNGIQEVEKWLSSLDKKTATKAAQIFITTLMGGRHDREGGPYFGNFHAARFLKPLYILMHRFIRTKEDIRRTGGGVYSPSLRDHAQDARNDLLNLIAKIPGKTSYVVLRQLAIEHPCHGYRPWMAKQAYNRAEEDGDLEAWSAEQVYAFDKLQNIAPSTHRQLFDLTVHRILDLKNWLERGNDSPWQTWQRANEETEMRTLIAGWLNQHCREQYTTAQEPELANSQRMDIWLHNPKVHSPVPIELKLLDKGWSGPKLCERLRNQLVGDYLREESAGCGVMLLIWQGRKSKKHWMINNHRVGLGELDTALKLYWQSISDKFLEIDAIDVLVIDLTQRGKVIGI